MQEKRTKPSLIHRKTIIRADSNRLKLSVSAAGTR